MLVRALSSSGGLALKSCLLGLLIALIGTPNLLPTPQAETITNNDVVRLVRGGLPSNVIVEKIRLSDCRFDLSTSGLLTLKDAGVPDAVIQAMLQASADVLGQQGNAARPSEAPAAPAATPSGPSDPFAASEPPSRILDLGEPPRSALRFTERSTEYANFYVVFQPTDRGCSSKPAYDPLVILEHSCVVQTSAGEGRTIALSVDCSGEVPAGFSDTPATFYGWTYRDMRDPLGRIALNSRRLEPKGNLEHVKALRSFERLIPMPMQFPEENLGAGGRWEIVSREGGLESRLTATLRRQKKGMTELEIAIEGHESLAAHDGMATITGSGEITMESGLVFPKKGQIKVQREARTSPRGGGAGQELQCTYFSFHFNSSHSKPN